MSTSGGTAFATRDEYEAWARSQDWYQTMKLPSGIQLEGSVRTDRRLTRLREIDWAGKRVLDIGCNSGQYCLFASQSGASKAVGIDVDAHRLEQARTIAVNEGLDVDFLEMSLFEAPQLGGFDIVLCYAVLTEIRDLFGALEALAKVTSQAAFIEIGLAGRGWLPLSPRSWRPRVPGVSPRTSMAELRVTKRGVWVVRPTLQVLAAALGDDFTLRRMRGGLRYDAVELRRVS